MLDDIWGIAEERGTVDVVWEMVRVRIVVGILVLLIVDGNMLVREVRVVVVHWRRR